MSANRGTLGGKMATLAFYNIDSATSGTGDYHRWYVLDSGTAGSGWLSSGTVTVNISFSYSDNGWIVYPYPNPTLDCSYIPSNKSPLIFKRAERLLQSMLTKQQRRMYERFGFFDLPSPVQKHVAYRIPKSGLIVMFEHGVPVKRLCIYEKEGLPPADWLIAAKLLVESEEPELLKIANHHKLDVHIPADPRVDRVPLLLGAA